MTSTKPTHDRVRATFVVLLSTLTAAACSAQPPPTGSSSPPPDVRPVVDQAPYWCEFISQESLRRVTGLRDNFIDHRDRAWNNDGGCRITKNPDRAGPASVWWSAIDDSRKRLKLAHENWDRNNPTPLPADLGEGFTAHYDGKILDHPYTVISRFACGDKTPWISISLQQVAKGRNATTDLVEIMRVAQKRYGEWKECTPKPPSK